MKLNETYDENGVISSRLMYSIHRIILKLCTFEELLNYENTLLKRIDGAKTHLELVNLLNTIKAKKTFEENIKKALTKNN